LNNKYIAAAGWDEACNIYTSNYDQESYVKTFTLEGHTNTISSCAISYDSRTVATGSFDTSVKLWNIQNGSLLTNIVGHKGRINCVSFISPVDNYVVSGADDRYVKFWDMNSGDIVNEFVCQGSVNSIHSIRPTGKSSIMLAAGDKIGNLYLTRLIRPGEY